jgi:hypothetical protein
LKAVELSTAELLGFWKSKTLVLSVVTKSQTRFNAQKVFAGKPVVMQITPIEGYLFDV